MNAAGCDNRPVEFDVLPVTRYKVNCSILWCEKTMRAAVIDPGGDVAEILNFIELLDLEPEVVLVTHGHFDHAGAAALLAQRTGARVEGPHEDDAHLLVPDRRDAEKRPFPLAELLPSRWLRHGDLVTFGEEVLEVLHCPGHSRGHVAYFSAERRQAFVGDILFRGSIGAWEHADGDLPTLLHSIRETLFGLGDDVAFIPGHGEASTFERERQDNPFVGDKAYAAWLTRQGKI